MVRENVWVEGKMLKIVGVVAAAALVLAGCGTTVQGKAVNDPATTAAPKSTAETTVTTTVAPVGDGDTTPTGTTLQVGQTATVLYETKDLSKESTRLAVTAVSVKKGAISDLSNFNLDAQTKVSEPYYITLTFKNAGPKAMEPGGIFGLIKAKNPAGDELSRLSLIGSFKKCEGTPPDSLAVGASFTECDVYIAPPGQGVSEVVFGFYLDSNRTEITWKV